MRMAPGFQKLTTPPRSVAMIASEAVASIAVPRLGGKFINPCASFQRRFVRCPSAERLFDGLMPLYKRELSTSGIGNLDIKNLMSSPRSRGGFGRARFFGRDCFRPGHAAHDLD